MTTQNDGSEYYMITLYHNPRCSKSREALALLEAQGQTPEIHLYLETPPSTKELKSIIAKLGISPRELLRKSEDLYKSLKLADPELSDRNLVKAMIENPKLIERPIAVLGDKAVIGRPPERVLELLASE